MQKMNKKLGKNAVAEICEAMKGKTGTLAKQEAVRQANRYDVSWQRIYEITAHLRPSRKQRSDMGKTKWEVKEGTDLWRVFQLVIVGAQAPDLALETIYQRVREEENREALLPTLPMLQNLLAKHGFSKKDRANRKVAYRRHEHPNPGGILRFDNSTLKEGYWFDVKTRKTLVISPKHINENHPSKNKNLVRVIQQTAVDDCTRRTHIRYLAKDSLTARDQLEFMLETFEIFGLPLEIITDNGSEMRKDVQQADQLLHAITENNGGFVHNFITAHNAKSNGKVEVRHQFAQKMETLIKLAIDEGDVITEEKLNFFAGNICKYYNEKHINRTTGQTPMARWFSRKIVAREIPSEILSSALLSDIFEVVMNGDCTVTRTGKTYQLPRAEPYLRYTTSKEKLKVIIPENIEVLLVQLPCDRADEWREINKVAATADVAGEYKAVADSDREQLRKRLKATRAAELTQTKEKRKQGADAPAIPYWNREVDVKKMDGVLPFPQKTDSVSAADISRVLPLPSALVSEREISYADAFKEFASEFADASEAREFLLNLFGTRDAVMSYSEVESAVKNREFTQRRGFLKAV